MQAACYIIYSKKLDKFHIGATHEDINKRLEKHNNHSYGNHRFTAKANDWVVFLIIEARDYPHAIRIERKIKAMKNRKYIHNLKKYPELLEKIKTQTCT
ncbi:MAG: GIY-YIG nuclease family protein [Prolixibacteraceae bacterium]|jgi:putative endonuclease|nr:GIY-YIG nuclease family protein [Prolixibacteraceae bacterium]